MRKRVYIKGVGMITALGCGPADVAAALSKNAANFVPLSVFPAEPGRIFPVGEVQAIPAFGQDFLPRTHQLADKAAAQAMANCSAAPDAVIIGTTTGGMLTTEHRLKEQGTGPEQFRYHSTATVAERIAVRYRCLGPVITVSTACSSGAVAIAIAVEMLRAGIASRVLAGGADALCRLTYHGFNMLQLVDPEGARPLDKNRRGMTVSEGSAMVLLDAGGAEGALAEIAGIGLSCDAYHPAAPHPQGQGAFAAMSNAITDAGAFAADIDYINLHGTGTWDNDLAEASAINALWDGPKPLMSSIKGACGHSLAAAGAVEAAVAALSVAQQLIPANTGCREPDPALNLDPVTQPLRKQVAAILSNSFGFGGNNAALVISSPGKFSLPADASAGKWFSVAGSACLTGAGHTADTVERVTDGNTCTGILAAQRVSEHLPPARIRRLKRLPRMVLALADEAVKHSETTESPASVYFGTGWGALSETHDFLTRLFQTNETLASPTDFIGSVHNAPAGHVALTYHATGANVTTTGGNYTFEQALLTASLMAEKKGEGVLVIGADEYHSKLSRCFDPATSFDDTGSDGGGALYLTRHFTNSFPMIAVSFYETSCHNPEVLSRLMHCLGGAEKINRAYAALMVGIPGNVRSDGEEQLQAFIRQTGWDQPVMDYRKITGEFATAAAVAAVLAVRFFTEKKIPAYMGRSCSVPLNGKGLLILGLGEFITAIEVMPE